MKGSSRPSEVKDFAVFNAEVLAEASMGDAEFAEQLIEVFVESSSGLIDEFEAALVTADYPRATRAIHSLKGSSRTLGLDRLGHVASELEMWSKALMEGDKNQNRPLTLRPFMESELRNEFAIAVGALRSLELDSLVA
ncbi:MAG: Hpt domain-containing protein [Fimbriimonadaceae bacterium]|nr:Hpt domain-containing protein [Fimbriimonadaceae bacterium]